MFAGGRRRSSNNVRAMQLFYELKQQFPTVPDHVVSACISNQPNDDQPSPSDAQILRQVVEAAANLQQELMGRNPTANATEQLPTPPTTPTIPDAPSKQPPQQQQQQQQQQKQRYEPNDTCITTHRLNNPAATTTQRIRTEMNQNSDSDNKPISNKAPKRPDTLSLKAHNFEIQQSTKCRDVHKLLNSEKPPRSPVTPKRATTRLLTNNKNSDSVANSRKTTTTIEERERPQTIETPTQTTDTLASPSSVNLSVNLNVKHTAAVHVVPQQPWNADFPSPRSYTSVNLTLRPPSSEPQPPIDITSQHASLTYSTSSFDSQKGLQSRLQITVSPTGGTVSSIRTRPRSFHTEDDGNVDAAPPVMNRSLQDLSTSPVLMKQQAKIEKLRIELRSEKSRLVALQNEVKSLENSKNDISAANVEAEIEKQLSKEIRHLRGQCDRLTVEIDRQTKNNVPLGETNEEFYRNIIGERSPTTHFPNRRSAGDEIPLQSGENLGPKWSCPTCTFQNHPLLDKCEQCDMAHIHGIAALANLSNIQLPQIDNLLSTSTTN